MNKLSSSGVGILIVLASVIPCLTLDESLIPRVLLITCVFLGLAALSTLYVVDWGRGAILIRKTAGGGAVKFRGRPQPGLAAACHGVLTTAIIFIVVGWWAVSKLPPLR